MDPAFGWVDSISPAATLLVASSVRFCISFALCGIAAGGLLHVCVVSFPQWPCMVAYRFGDLAVISGSALGLMVMHFLALQGTSMTSH